MNKTFTFLKKLKNNNNREWFQKNKPEYESALEEMVSFADQLLAEMNRHDVIETPSGKKSLYRIYRDVRFGNDKTPYKTHWAGGMKRATSERRGGYYYHIGLERSYVVGGFFGPNAQDLLQIRNQIAQEGDFLRDIVTSKPFKKSFVALQGAQLKTAPRGFEKDHPEIDLLRYKQFYIGKEFTNEEVLSENFPKNMSDAFEQMRPFLDCMTEMLTTDLNGRSLV